MTLKQSYIHQNAPFPFDFKKQKKNMFSKIIQLITLLPRNSWNTSGFNLSSIIQTYRIVYGLQTQQLQNILTLLSNIVVQQFNLSIQIKVLILKILNRLTIFEIKISQNLKINNNIMFFHYENLSKKIFKQPLKIIDNYIEELSKFTLFMSKYGQDLTEKAVQISINKHDLSYLALFIGSLNSQEQAQKLIKQLFIDNSIWQHDIIWFYIVSQIIKKYPNIDYNKIYYSLFHDVIKIITSLIQPLTQHDVKKLISSDSTLGIRCIVKSAAIILVYLILPISQPQSQYIWSGIERIFNLIINSLDHVNQPTFIDEFFFFLKAFTKYYLQRYRNQRKLYLISNQHYIQDQHGEVMDKLAIDATIESRFDALWGQIINKILYFEDFECRPAKVLSDLVMYKCQVFLQPILDAIISLLSRDDLNIVSLYTTKITILFLQEYIIIEQPRYITTLVQILRYLLIALQKLGISENLDMLELVFRAFLYFNTETIQSIQVQSIITECLEIILQNLEPISIGLQNSETDEAQLYIDFSNIFFPLFLQLDSQQIEHFTQKFIYKCFFNLPQHPQAFLMISVIEGYLNTSFTQSMIKKISRALLSDEQQQQQNSNKIHNSNFNFLKQISCHLLTKNEIQLKWYCKLLQSCYQYNPNNIIKDWKYLQKIIILLLLQYDNNILNDLALDLLFNIILNLCKIHITPKSFINLSNYYYNTMNIQWQQTTKQHKELLLYIYNQYFVQLSNYMYSRYNNKIINNKKKNNNNNNNNHNSSQKLQQQQEQQYINYKIHNITLPIKSCDNLLMDNILIPKVPNIQALQQKKYIYKILSIQYTVLSSFMLRVPFTKNTPSLGGVFFNQPQFIHFREKSCEYLSWVLKVLAFYDIVNQPALARVFNFFWRQAHDQVFFTNIINITHEKIVSYYYAQIHRKKQLMRTPFLLINQAYLTHMMRMQLYLEIQPTATINDPSYLEKHFILSLQLNTENNLHSYINNNWYNPHKYHRQLLDLCRYKLDPAVKNSYSFNYIHANQKSEKQKYQNAMRIIISNLKQVQNCFGFYCCVNDPIVWQNVMQMVNLYQIFEKKKEKTTVIEIYYLSLIFGFQRQLIQFETNVIQSSQKYATIMKYNDQNSEINNGQNFEINGYHTNNQQRNQINNKKQSVQLFIKIVINKINKFHKIDKDCGIYLLFIILFADYLDLQNPIIGQIIILFTNTKLMNILGVFNICKTGLFHFINRYNWNKKKTKLIKNIPIKRSFSEYLDYRLIGGCQIESYENIEFQKSQHYFYPSEFLTKIQYKKLQNNGNQEILFQLLNNYDIMLLFFKYCSMDKDLKNTDTQVDVSIFHQQNRSLALNGYILLNYMLDYNPKKVQICLTFIENFSIHDSNFYSRLIKKIIRLGNQQTIQNLKLIAIKLRNNNQIQQIKISLFISTEILPYLNQNDNFTINFLNFLAQCSNQLFQFSHRCLYSIFHKNFLSSYRIYQIIIKRLREEKGSSRLRHLQVMNTFMMSQGFFARKAAKQGIVYLMKGIDQGSDEVAQAIITMIVSCFIIAINLNTIPIWVNESSFTLTRQGVLYKINQQIGYEINQDLKHILQQITLKTKQQIDMPEKNLKIYSKIANKILNNLTIHRFNQFFYSTLKDLIFHMLKKVPQQGQLDDQVIYQLRNSEYPQQIYTSIMTELVDLSDQTQSTIKKKLKYLQGMAINRSFCINKVQIPDICSKQKNLTLEFVITASNVMRMMIWNELTQYVNSILSQQFKDINKLMAAILAAGVRQYFWKQSALKQILKYKKTRLVKEFISFWWKGKNPQTQEQKRLHMLVRSVQNPYNYFA